jgi:Rps23 Pro-64 3,4-dihydroxylase Tpa1-like proline 4-hydroxylase
MLDYYHLGAEEMGIRVYKNAIPNCAEVLETISSTIDASLNPMLTWQQAKVGYNVYMPDYRDCWDCKLSVDFVTSLGDEHDGLRDAYGKIVMPIGSCVQNYSQFYNMNITYMEAVNFVKYGVGEHFDVHSDHGSTYTCTVSTTAYLNDDYEGGELWFNYLGIKFKPKAGDIVVFPSTFIYSHASLPVESGVKFSAVTMFDYNDSNHKAGGYAS